MNERVCRRRLGDALQHRLPPWPARCLRLSTAFSLISSNSSRSTCSPTRKVVSPASVDLDLLQHLAHDHLDVLVVDLDALQAVDALDLV